MRDQSIADCKAWSTRPLEIGSLLKFQWVKLFNLSDVISNLFSVSWSFYVVNFKRHQCIHLALIRHIRSKACSFKFHFGRYCFEKNDFLAFVSFYKFCQMFKEGVICNEWWLPEMYFSWLEGQRSSKFFYWLHTDSPNDLRHDYFKGQT